VATLIDIAATALASVLIVGWGSANSARGLSYTPASVCPISTDALAVRSLYHRQSCSAKLVHWVNSLRSQDSGTTPGRRGDLTTGSSVPRRMSAAINEAPAVADRREGMPNADAVSGQMVSLASNAVALEA